jgi:hypothetical protein
VAAEAFSGGGGYARRTFPLSDEFVVQRGSYHDDG